MVTPHRLVVEGKNDAFVIIELLATHGIRLLKDGSDPQLPVIEEGKKSKTGTGSVEQLLDLIPERIRFSNGSIGFVLDADPLVGLASRWQSVRDRLRREGIDVPAEIPAGGYIGDLPDSGDRVGVWLMPDNVRPGMLESFLMDLVGPDDDLLQFAREATTEAKQRGARYREVATEKAVIHTWLAWQEEPGQPYGVAIRSRYFSKDASATEGFLIWFKRLYGL